MAALTLSFNTGKFGKRLQGSEDGDDASCRLDPAYKLPGEFAWVPLEPLTTHLLPSVLLLQWFSV